MKLMEYNNSALSRFYDISSLPVSAVANRMQTYINAVDDKEFPEHQAVVFYLLNHATSIIASSYHWDEELSEKDAKVFDMYIDKGSKIFIRMFCYVLLILLRESRHVKTFSGDKLHGLSPDIISFQKTIGGKSSNEVVVSFLNNPPMVSMGKLLTHVKSLFYDYHFDSQYGGKAWGAVADVMYNFVFGTSSAEIMVDQAFNSAHNNGPIFNKGILYFTYDAAQFMHILDVQKTGQIPEFVNGLIVNGGSSFSHVNHEVSEIFDIIEDVVWPDSLECGADYGKVNEVIGSAKYGAGVPGNKVIHKKFQVDHQLSLRVFDKDREVA